MRAVPTGKFPAHALAAAILNWERGCELVDVDRAAREGVLALSATCAPHLLIMRPDGMGDLWFRPHFEWGQIYLTPYTSWQECEAYMETVQKLLETFTDSLQVPRCMDMGFHEVLWASPALDAAQGTQDFDPDDAPGAADAAAAGGAAGGGAVDAAADGAAGGADGTAGVAADPVAAAAGGAPAGAADLRVVRNIVIAGRKPPPKSKNIKPRRRVLEYRWVVSSLEKYFQKSSRENPGTQLVCTLALIQDRRGELEKSAEWAAGLANAWAVPTPKMLGSPSITTPPHWVIVGGRGLDCCHVYPFGLSMAALPMHMLKFPPHIPELIQEYPPRLVVYYLSRLRAQSICRICKADFSGMCGVLITAAGTILPHCLVCAALLDAARLKRQIPTAWKFNDAKHTLWDSLRENPARSFDLTPTMWEAADGGKGVIPPHTFVENGEYFDPTIRSLGDCELVAPQRLSVYLTP